MEEHFGKEYQEMDMYQGYSHFPGSMQPAQAPQIMSFNSTPTPTDSPLQSTETSPNPDRNSIAGWQEGYRPVKKQKKAPRPGEGTFRVPMSAEQRKSLGASVRPKKPAPAAKLVPVEAPYQEEVINSKARGGTKLKFRAYGSTRKDSVASQSPLGQSSGAGIQAFPAQNPVYINFLAAPLDDGPKLAWWLAQQVCRVSISRAPAEAFSSTAEISPAQFYGNGAQVSMERRSLRCLEADADRRRENDLRITVCLQASQRFGPGDFYQKNDWIMHEIARRRAVREDKQITLLSKSGSLPDFPHSEQLRISLLKDESMYTAVEQFRTSVIDVLFPAPQYSDPAHCFNSLQSLSRAISNRTKQDEDAFYAAIVNIADNEAVFINVKTTMNQLAAEEAQKAELDEFNGDQSPQDHGTTIIRTINKALAILRELNEFGRQRQAEIAQETKKHEGPRKPSGREHKQHLKDFGITESQLDDFLVSANDGPLKPDANDDVALELFGNDLEIEVPAPSGPRIKVPEADGDIWTTINSVITTLLDRCMQPPKRGRRSKKILDGEAHAQQQAQNVKKLLERIGIGDSMNLDKSTPESEMFSHFHERLREFKTTREFGEDLHLPQHIIDPESLSPASASLPNATNPFAVDDPGPSLRGGFDELPPLALPASANPSPYFPPQTTEGYLQPQPLLDGVVSYRS